MLEAHPHVLVTGVVPDGASGMRDYGDLLAGDLRRAGVDAEVGWAVNDGRRVGATTRSTRELFALGRRVARGGTVVWNYTPVTCGYRGIPGPAALFALYLRLRGVSVVVVLHELAEPWRGQPPSTKVRSVAAVGALIPVLLGAGAWLVTTEGRVKKLALPRRLLRRTVVFVPVFSNLGEAPCVEPAETHEGFRVGVLDYAATYARPDVVVAALRQLQDEGLVTMVLIGSPGPGSPKTARWLDLADSIGLQRVETTGVLPVEELGRCLAGVDVVVLPNAQGPASRKGTLAAAVAHGCPVVSVDGPMRWHRLVEAGAVLVTPPHAGALAEVLRRLRADRAERERLGHAAETFYMAEMSLARTTAVVLSLVGK